jgi:CRP-like cAMP-binding protein
LTKHVRLMSTHLLQHFRYAGLNDPVVQPRAPLTPPHPVLDALPSETLARLVVRGSLRSYAAEELIVKSRTARFVLNGALAAFDAETGVCVGSYGPGSVQGLEGLTDAAEPHLIEAVCDTYVLEAGVALMQEVIGPYALAQMCAREGHHRLRAMEQTIGCACTHGLNRRLPRLLGLWRQWAGSDRLSVTQERLARMLGVQRTSINAVLQLLKKQGGAASSRGRVLIRNPEALARAACTCGRDLASPYA